VLLSGSKKWSRPASIAAFEARISFTKSVERVVQGEAIIMTRYSSPVAKIVPFDEADKGDEADKDRVENIIARIKDFNAGQTLNGLSIRDLRDEGRR
jgi:prevent-host-death family protein